MFNYSDKGKIVSLCRAKKLYYVTTKGGYGTDDFGFKYAEGLDVYGNNVEDFLEKAKENIDNLL